MPLLVERLWVAIGWLLLAGSVVGWPLSALTFAREEPLTVLGLSWLALTLNAAGILVTAQAQKKLVERLARWDADADGDAA